MGSLASRARHPDSAREGDDRGGDGEYRGRFMTNEREEYISANEHLARHSRGGKRGDRFRPRRSLHGSPISAGSPDAARAAMSPQERPSKRDAFLAFLGEGWVSVHLDARRRGVSLPDDLTDTRTWCCNTGGTCPSPSPTWSWRGRDPRHAVLLAHPPPDLHPLVGHLHRLLHRRARHPLLRGRARGRARWPCAAPRAKTGRCPAPRPTWTTDAPPGELSEADTEPVRAPFLRSVPTDETNPDRRPMPDRAPPCAAAAARS